MQPFTAGIVFHVLIPIIASTQISLEEYWFYFCFSHDSFSNWCASTALAHAVKGSKDLKEQLLRVQLATGAGNRFLIV